MTVRETSRSKPFKRDTLFICVCVYHRLNLLGNRIKKKNKKKSVAGRGPFIRFPPDWLQVVSLKALFPLIRTRGKWIRSIDCREAFLQMTRTYKCWEFNLYNHLNGVGPELENVQVGWPDQPDGRFYPSCNLVKSRQVKWPNHPIIRET